MLNASCSPWTVLSSERNLSISVQLPIGSGKDFTGLVDLITKQQVTWQGNSRSQDGRAFQTSKFQATDELMTDFCAEVLQARAALIEQVFFKSWKENQSGLQNGTGCPFVSTRHCGLILSFYHFTEWHWNIDQIFFLSEISYHWFKL